MEGFLTKEQKRRYSRQIAVPEIGGEGQEKICNSKVLIIGCGALGSMVAMQLAGAGVGTIGICDFDKIDVSNLQRQIFYKNSEIGELKLEILEKRIKDLNSEIDIKTFGSLITGKKAALIFSEFDFIVDATDNPESKKIIGEVSKNCLKPCCIAGVKDFEGQIMTFLPEDSRFEEYFGITSADGFLPCSLGGVMGPTVALCASIQASEVIKYIVNKGNLLSGELFKFNLLDNSFHKFSL